MKKQILTLALITTLPLTAMADNPVVSVGPAAVPSNGTAVIATANPPYQTLTPTNDDKSHIASTAYVKGAYNDSIAAVNKVAHHLEANYADLDEQIGGKQDALYNENGDYIDAEIVDIAAADEYGRSGFTNDSGIDMETHLVTAEGVASEITGYLHGYNGARIRVYTTWDNDNASTGVMIENVADIQ